MCSLQRDVRLTIPSISLRYCGSSPGKRRYLPLDAADRVPDPNAGEQPAYSDNDLKERLLTWDRLQPGQFPAMLEERTKDIHHRALTLFGMKLADFDALFAGG